MVGAAGFELATSWSQTKRSTKLSYAPFVKEPLTLAHNLKLPNYFLSNERIIQKIEVFTS